MRKLDKVRTKSKGTYKNGGRPSSSCSLSNVLLLVALLFVLSIFVLAHNFEVESVNVSVVNTAGNLKGSLFNSNPIPTNVKDAIVTDNANNLDADEKSISSVNQQSKRHIEMSIPLGEDTVVNRNNLHQYYDGVMEMKKQQENVLRVLKGHLINRIGIDNIGSTFSTIEDLLLAIYSQPQCGLLSNGVTVPVFTAMASVQSDVYWQLSQNFMYSMVQFNISDCAVMICVSDPGCMQRCKDSSFPCYSYKYSNVYKDIDSSSLKRGHVKKRQKIEQKKEKEKFGVKKFYTGGVGERRTTVTPMEQIANLKLYHLPKALALGVDLFILDLDVGFINNPMDMIRSVTETRPDVDIFVQSDMGFVMDRTVEKWKTWYVHAIPNIGIFFCKGNSKTVRMFDEAWIDYQATTLEEIRGQPGKDQNKVLDAIRWAANQDDIRMKWDYFPNTSAVLVDKVYKFHSTLVELGGEVAEQVLNPPFWHAESYTSTSHQIESVSAAHTTCYEKWNKVTGLKAVNAFWNPFYYDPSIPTITKQLVYTSERELNAELQSLVYIAIATKRSLIIPNLLGSRDLSGIQPRFRTGVFNYFDLLNTHTPTGIHNASGDREEISNSISIHSTGLSSYWSEKVMGAQYRHRNTDADKQAMNEDPDEYIALWPGFRVMYMEPDAKLPLQVLEPAFYWRMWKHYKVKPPRPTTRIYYQKSDTSTSDVNRLDTIIRDILSLDRAQHPRVVLQMLSARDSKWAKAIPTSNLKSNSVHAVPDLGLVPFAPSSQRSNKELARKIAGSVQYSTLDLKEYSKLTGEYDLLDMVERIHVWTEDSVGKWPCNPVLQVESLSNSYSQQLPCYVKALNHYAHTPALNRRQHAQYQHFLINQYDSNNEEDIVEVTDPQEKNTRAKYFRDLMGVLSNGATVRPCKGMWRVINGNRSCFDKCK